MVASKNTVAQAYAVVRRFIAPEALGLLLNDKKETDERAAT